MLQGCWRLGQDTQGSIGVGGRSEMCAVKAGRICFGANGGGERRSTAVCPATGTITCTAPITARFGNDNTLGTTQPAVNCQPHRHELARLPGSGDHDQLAHVAIDELAHAAQQRIVVARVAHLHRAPDLGRIAADVGAMAVEDPGQARDLVGLAAGRVPDVGVLGDHPQRLPLAATADPEGRIRLLHRLRIGDRVRSV